MADGLTWHVTGLWHPSDSVLSDLPYYGQIADPVDGLVEIPLNDSRTASVTVSEYDDIIPSVLGHTYARCLKVYYRDLLVFWGPIKTIEYGLDEEKVGTVTLNAVDPSIRLINQFLVRGDLGGALGASNEDRADVSVDFLGLRLLRDAGLNTPEQNTEDYPDIGIIDGINTADTSLLTLGVQRGDQIWSQMTQLSQSLGPDFELEPVEDTVGAYCKLNTYTAQGSDVSADVVFHYGTGKQNLATVSFQDGSEYITHVHVLDRDLTYRFTEANTDAASETGPYVMWDATDYSAKGIVPADAETVLRDYGTDVLKAYSRPLMTCTVTMPVEDDSDENSFVYGTDYAVGDTVGVAGRAGLVDLEQAPYRITAVRLKQASEDSSRVQPEIDTVPDRVTAAGDAVGGVVGS